MHTISISEIVIILAYLPRKALDLEYVKSLKAAILRGDSLPPIIIQLKGRILIDGWHRLEAFKQLGFISVRVKELDISESECLPTSIRINSHHGKKLNDDERDDAIRFLRFERGMSIPQIADYVNMSRSGVRDICLRIKGSIIDLNNANIDCRTKTGRRYVSKLTKRKGKYHYERMPKKIMVAWAKKRFIRLNPEEEPDNVVFEDFWTPDSNFKEYIEGLNEEYPQFEWFDRFWLSKVEREPEWLEKGYYPVKFRLSMSRGGWIVRGRILKEDQRYVEHKLGSLQKGLFVNIPLDPLRHDDSFGVRRGLIPSQEEEDERFTYEYDETHPDFEELEDLAFWRKYDENCRGWDEWLNARAEMESSESSGEFTYLPSGEFVPKDIARDIKRYEWEMLPSDVKNVMGKNIPG
jgi:transcriptional regulator with XRE-family HTH domain